MPPRPPGASKRTASPVERSGVTDDSGEGATRTERRGDGSPSPPVATAEQHGSSPPAAEPHHPPTPPQPPSPQLAAHAAHAAR
eukprot:2317843-Prymnesium_polylepis.1